MKKSSASEPLRQRVRQNKVPEHNKRRKTTNDDTENQFLTTTIGDREPDKFIQLPVEILETILTYLDPPNLLKSRLINPTWKKLSTRLLRSQPSAFPIVFSAPGYYTGREHDQVPSLTKFIAQSLQFWNYDQLPYVNFKFHGMDLEWGPLNTFFLFYGNFLTTLSLVQCSPLAATKLKGPIPDYSIAYILTHHLKNLTNLFVDDHGIFERKKMRKQLPSFTQYMSKNKLPQLTTLSVAAGIFSLQIGEEIVKSCDNLTSFYNEDSFQQETLDMLLKLNKLHLLQKMKLTIKPNKLEFIKNLAIAQPKLKIFQIDLDNLYPRTVYKGPGPHVRNSRDHPNDPDFLREAVIALNKILDSCQDTLQVFVRFQPISFLEGVNFPVMNNLKRLEIINEHDTWVIRGPGSYGEVGRLPWAIFPDQLKLAEVFPTLTHIQIKLALEKKEDGGGGMTCDEYWSTFFPFDLKENAVPNVRTLTILQKIPGSKEIKIFNSEQDKEKFRLWFPNLIHLDTKEFRGQNGEY